MSHVPQLAKYQIVAFFVKNKTAIKINNLIVAHWLNIFCKRGGIKWCNCYQRTVSDLHFHIPEFIDPENWPKNSQCLNPVDFVAWGALQQKLYR